MSMYISICVMNLLHINQLFLLFKVFHSLAISNGSNAFQIAVNLMEWYCSEIPIDAPLTYLDIAAAFSIISIMIRYESLECMTYDGLKHHFLNTSVNNVKVRLQKSTWCLYIYLLAEVSFDGFSIL